MRGLACLGWRTVLRVGPAPLTLVSLGGSQIFFRSSNHVRSDLLLVLLTGAALLALLFFVLYLKASASVRSLNERLPILAKEQFEAWKRSHLADVEAQQRAIARREAQAALVEWRSESEAMIRQDAIQRSQAVITGRVTEHLVPLAPVFPYSPKDARFLGSPIDLIVFDGCAEGDTRRVIFVEVKTGSSSLSPQQRQIRDAIRAGRVEWHELRITTGSA
jgi:predicted Holliday junction resolvase-like endonuclease